MDLSNPIGFLQEYCARNCMAFPSYQEGNCVGADHCREFICNCHFLEYNAEGKGNTKKLAKRASAAAMVKILIDNEMFKKSPLSTDVMTLQDTSSAATWSKNAISVLLEYCQKRTLPLPTYLNDSHPIEGFICECIVQGKNTIGKGKTKKAAKTDSAFKMLQELNIDIENVSSVAELPSYNASVKNPILTLNELCTKKKLPAPVFEEDMAFAGVFTMKVAVGETVASGDGSTKQGR